MTSALEAVSFKKVGNKNEYTIWGGEEIFGSNNSRFCNTASIKIIGHFKGDVGVNINAENNCNSFKKAFI